MIARRSTRHASQSAESGVIDAPGVVRDNEKASSGVFAPTEPRETQPRPNTREVSWRREASRQLGLLRLAAPAIKDRLRRRHAKDAEWASAWTASRRRLEGLEAT